MLRNLNHYNKDVKCKWKFFRQAWLKCFGSLLCCSTGSFRKFRENLKIGREHSLVSSFPTKNRFLAIVIKNYEKTDMEIFCSCPIYLIFIYLTMYFVQNCWNISKIFIYLLQNFLCRGLYLLREECIVWYIYI